jgi:hypothetical protein
MADHLARRDVQARGEIAQQHDQRFDLRRTERAAAIVVELDADRGRVEIGDGAPAPGAGVPGTALIGDQLVTMAIGADQVVRTDRPTAVGRAQRMQALLHRLLLGVVDDDDDRRARVLVG